MGAGANPQMTANPYAQAAGAQQGALAGTAAGMTYQPAQIQAISAAEGMSTYQNPYEQAVVDKTLRDVGGAAQIGLNTLGAQAEQARAFGGSRHGIAEAEALKGYQQQALDKAAALRQQGFNTALAASQFDVGTQMGAQQQNVANQLAGYQFRQGAANQLANLGRQSFGYGQQIQQQQAQQGAMQRQIQQQLIDQARGGFQRYTGAPAQGLNTLLSTLAGVPNVAGQQQSFQPGLFNYLQLGAQMMPS